jgi:hypothetical protein
MNKVVLSTTLSCVNEDSELKLLFYFYDGTFYIRSLRAMVK